MSSPSTSAIRRILKPHNPLLIQRRHARVHDVRLLTVTHAPRQKILDRYQEKLQQKARQEGLQSVEQLQEAYRDKIEETRKKAAMSTGTATDGAQKSSTPAEAVEGGPVLHQPPPPPPTPKSSSGAPGIKPLSSYLDLSKVSALPAKEVEYIWRLRHASDPLSLCAVIPLATYERIYRTARNHPQFVLPLPRPMAEDGSGDVQQASEGFDDGKERSAADIHFLQWGFHPPATSVVGSTANTHTSTVLFTQLAAFKLHGTYAQPHTTITHHLDLADSHGLVLLNGSVVKGRGVSVEEGRWLLMCLQKFYDHEGHGGGVGREKRQGLLKQFSSGDQGFNLEELVDEAERIS